MNMSDTMNVSHCMVRTATGGDKVYDNDVLVGSYNDRKKCIFSGVKLVFRLSLSLPRKIVMIILCIVRPELGSRWVRVRVSCRVRFSVGVSFTVRVSVRDRDKWLFYLATVRQLNHVVEL